ncbi:MAG: hypothetical protein F6J97_01080 [Leptolyngbya sp. SIO4C1]|nr:hypothetical protein [Leptolyngbya sp. SIO4C1]
MSPAPAGVRRIASPEFELICQAVDQGSPVLVLGEAGMIGDLPLQVAQQFESELSVAVATYKGSGKRFFAVLAEQLDIPTVETKYDKDGEAIGEKPLTMDQLKDEIADNVGDRTLLVLPEAKRLTTGIRYWLEDLMVSGVRVVCFAAVNPGRDIFLDMLEIELTLPSDRMIREVMASEAQRQGLLLDQSRLAALQPLAGRNPMLARKVIRNERLGLNRQSNPQHTQYVVIMPVIIAALFSFAVVRFVGLGTGNQALYIFGGVSLVAGMMLKQLGQVRGARKRLGQ